jgi:hypothetical protein
MKIRICILALLLTAISGNIIFAQTGMPINAKTGLVCYTEGISVQTTKSELYQRAKNWIENYTGLKGIIATVTDDKESGKIVLHGNFLLTQNQKNYYIRYMNFKMTIYCKDNTWIYEITNLYTYNLSQGGMYTTNSEEGNCPVEKSDAFDVTDFSKKNKNAQNTDEIIQGIITSLKEAMGKQAVAEGAAW